MQVRMDRGLSWHEGGMVQNLREVKGPHLVKGMLGVRSLTAILCWMHQACKMVTRSSLLMGQRRRRRGRFPLHKF